MRGDAITKSAAMWVTALGFAALLSACDSGPIDDGVTVPAPLGNGRVALSWTLNGVALTPDSCTKERISSMSVLIASDRDPSLDLEFVNVTCALDRFSSIMTPVGSVRVFVDAMLDLPGGSQCRRYTGQASTFATTQFPSVALSVPLHALAGCP